MSNAQCRVVVILLLSIFLSSCRVWPKPKHRKLIIENSATVTKVRDTATTPMAKRDTIVVSDSKKQLMASLLPVYSIKTQYHTFTGKARMHFVGQDDDKTEFTAHFRLKRDSVIWISITSFGLQVARVMITPDSVKYINYLKEEVRTMPYTKVSELLPVNVEFPVLQNMIIGNALLQSTATTDATDVGGTWTVQVEDNEFIQQLSYNKADTTIRTCQIRTHTPNGLECVVQYGNYDHVNERKFAFSRTVNAIDTKGAQYYLDMNFMNATFNSDIDFPFSIPKNYNRK